MTGAPGGALTVSRRQLEALTLGRRHARFTWSVGSVRSGKTWATLRGWLHWAGRCWTGADFALVAHGWRQMHGVVLAGVREWADEAGIDLRPWGDRPMCVEVPDARGGRNRFWPVVAGGDAAKNIDGLTLGGCYCDELVNMPAEVWEAVVMRCSLVGAKLAATMNPGGPLHPVKRQWIDPTVSDGTGELLTFGLADNPTLDRDYIRMLTERYAGAQRQRKVYGLWAATTGAVWPALHKAVSRPPADEDPWRWEVSADYARSSVTHAVLWARYGRGAWAVDEWRHDADDDGPLTAREQADRLVAHFARPGRDVTAWIVDPTAEGLIAELRHALHGAGESGVVVGARNDVSEGIDAVEQWLAQGRVRIAPHCRETIAECSSYRWDDAAGARGDDRPARDHDHAPDALRYYVATRAAAEAVRTAAPVPLGAAA